MSEKKCERNSPAGIKFSEERGEEVLPGTGAGIPLQPVEMTMVMQVVPLQSMEVLSEADIHLHPMEDTTLEQMDVP
ncbi:hypothetical protein HGM15179_019974 [Zosterops borbonicus]|uniref:Uncharacterized protein n=1 Tax=Zosterops borbonicus TaxID=364589 RepID=A0A8K1FUL5_9PASS|nr:hypothetical protein HGM15179_019974 [Zosterops borbonicus]